MTLRDLGFYVRGRINSGLTRVINARRPAPALASTPLGDLCLDDARPLSLVPLLEGRDNAAREAAMAWYLDRAGIAAARHRFATFEGSGVNFGVEVGGGDRVVVLIAHHDAVPGSPGANDNAAAVAILLHLLPRLAVPPTLRVRLLFTAAEELGYLGARTYAREVPSASIAGVLSLELCGIGDCVVVWDADAETDFLRRVTGSFESLGLRRDEGYHVVGRVPVFGSDHRAFAAAGVPAYGLSAVPLSEADALRRFVLSPVRSALLHAVRRPRPFDTYHTSGDAGSTLEPRALELVSRAISAVVAGMA